MKIPMALVALAVGAIITLQAWTLNAVVTLKERVAAIEVKVR